MSGRPNFVVRAWRRVAPKTALGWVHVVTGFLGALVVLGMVGYVVSPSFKNPHQLGIHDWDTMETYRYLVQKTILRFHQIPFWNPYACGGHTAWAGFESDSTVVSPWLPAYLALSLPIAIRIEVIGSAVWGAAGAWLLASRFTRSRALMAFVAVVFAVNGRWALQTSVGHAWHLVYAWTPWALYFFDRAANVAPELGPSRKRDVILTGVCLAMMIYSGGIYPLPQTALFLVLYALVLAAMTRTWRPLVRLAACAATGIGLAAPRLIPIYEEMRRFPRLTSSTETMDLSALIEIMTSKDQDLYSNPGHVAQWGWHEWGMYVGWVAVVAVGLGAVFGRGTRERALKGVGVALFALAFGRFHQYAPWPLLHRLPVFSSQHVPSRWMYPGILVLACVAVATGERLLVRAGRARWAIEALMVFGVAWVAWDIAGVARVPLTHAFAVEPLKVTESLGDFHTEDHLPAPLQYDASAWSPTSLTAEMANIGTIDCSTSPGLHNYVRGADGRTPGLGAYGKGDAQYRGEAWIAEGRGTAVIVAWTPNVMDVRVDGATPGDTLILNQNWDPGWSADGKRAIDWRDTVAAPIGSASQVIRFRFVPRTLWLGILVFLGTIAALVVPPILRRRATRRAARAAGRLAAPRAA
jgi:hypothetical protein